MATNLTVIYIGGNSSFDDCSESGILTKGQRYTVKERIHEENQVLFVLDGIEGQFNTAWFKKVNFYMASGKHVPKVGAELCNFHRLMPDGKWEIVQKTSIVESIVERDKDLFEVNTKHSTYIYQLSQKNTD